MTLVEFACSLGEDNLPNLRKSCLATIETHCNILAPKVTFPIPLFYSIIYVKISRLSHASFGSVRPRAFWRESSSNKMAAVSGSSPKGRLFTKAPMRDLTKGLVAIMVE